MIKQSSNEIPDDPDEQISPRTTRKRSILSENSLPPIAERKSSLASSSNYKPITSTPRISKTETNTDVSQSRRDLFRRTSSININQNAKRLSSFNAGRAFRNLGGKVASMVKVKMAFQKKNKMPEEDEEDGLEIKELPKEPRFASTLSPEAQYAIMKGYEDVVLNSLSSSCPEYRPLLKRNKTPKAGIRVREQQIGLKLKAKNVDRIDSVSSESEDGHVSQSGSSPVVTPRSSPENISNVSRIKKQRALSVCSSDLYDIDGTSKSDYDGRSSVLMRTRSLPFLIPKDRQLAMTYRYQCAMDILDTIRGKQGWHPLSPRLKSRCGTNGLPIREYNMWATAWNQEFQQANAKA